MENIQRYARPVGLAALLLSFLIVFPACDSDGDDGPSAEVTVMTYNVYLGGDLFPVTTATTNEEIIASVTELWATIQATRFDLRVQAIADQIEAIQPDLIGLQEVSLFRTQSPSDFLQGTTTPNATEVSIDFLVLLTDELAARNLDYRVVIESDNADVELPAVTGPGEFTDIRLTDRDVILAREGVSTSGAQGTSFNPASQAFVEVPPGSGNRLEFTRGYQTTQATVGEVTFTFANSHLEVDDRDPEGAALAQTAQAVELVLALGTAPTPVVLVGDFNSAADGSGTVVTLPAPVSFTGTTYGFLTSTYTDAAAEAGVTGNTCCQADDLTNATPSLNSRIDLILHRGGAETLSAEVLGDEPGDRVDSGGTLLWPSDHAGVVATLRIQN